MVPLVLRAGTLDVGADWGGLNAGIVLCRVVFSFGLGVAIQRIDKSRVPRINPWFILVLVAAVTYWQPVGAYVPWCELGVVLLLLPACVLLAVVCDPVTGWQSRLFGFMGEASYGIYLIHVPILAMSYGLFQIIKERYRLFHNS